MTSVSATHKPLSFQKVFQQSEQLLGRHWLMLVGVLAVVILPTFSFFYLLSILPESELMKTAEPIVLLFMPILLFVLSIALTIAIHHLFSHGYVNIFVIYREAVCAIPGFLKVYFLCFLRIVFWSLLLIIPGIVSSINCSLAGLIYLVDNVGGQEAIRLSRGLVRRSFFKYVSGLSLIAFILIGSMFVSLYYLDGLLMKSSSGDVTLFVVTINAVEVLIVAGVFLLTHIFLYFTYQELKSE